MAILSGSLIRAKGIFSPCRVRTRTSRGLSFGLGPAGYDVRIAEGLELEPGEFALASIFEHIEMPTDCLGLVHDKSSWARMGLAVQNTVIEPGWRGYLTIELTNHSVRRLGIEAGDPIAQIVMHRVEGEVEPYEGAYQAQTPGVTPSVLEPKS